MPGFVYKIRISVQDPNRYEQDLNLCEQDDALYEQDRDCKNINSVLMFCMMGFLGVTASQDIKIFCNKYIKWRFLWQKIDIMKEYFCTR